jgi:hypothetical protein
MTYFTRGRINSLILRSHTLTLISDDQGSRGRLRMT